MRIAGPSKRDYDLGRLRRIQERIAAKIVTEDDFGKPISRVTGFDIAYFDDEAIAAAVTMDFDTLAVLEEAFVKEEVLFPYVATFLAFREGPLIIKLTKKLRLKPDVLMVNSHGMAHPLFCGCASYVGVCLGRPTLGVAGSRLVGEYEYAPKKLGEWAPLKYQDRIVGAALLSKKGSKPIFISIGHMISLETAIEIAKHFLTGSKLPEPIKLAHDLANRIRRQALI